MKQSPEDVVYTLQVRGTEKYADLAMLQSVLLEPLAEALARVLREKARNGELRLGKRNEGDD